MCSCVGSGTWRLRKVFCLESLVKLLTKAALVVAPFFLGALPSSVCIHNLFYIHNFCEFFGVHNCIIGLKCVKLELIERPGHAESGF